MLREDGREHRAAYLDDDGFTTQLMAALPMPATPRGASRWLLRRAAAGIGMAFALPATVLDVAREVMRVMVGQPVSLTGIAAGVLALGATTCRRPSSCARTKGRRRVIGTGRSGPTPHG
jgi:hypothetical protein